MKKSNLFEILYIIPEIIVVYFILAKFCSPLDTILYHLCIVYAFIIMQALHNKWLPASFILLLPLPLLLLALSPLSSAGRINAAFILEIAAVIRLYLFFKKRIYGKYTNGRFILESAVMIAISLVFTKSPAIYLAVVFKLVLLIENNMVNDADTRMNHQDFLLIAGSFISLGFIPLYHVLGYEVQRLLTILRQFALTLFLYPASWIGGMVERLIQLLKVREPKEEIKELQGIMGGSRLPKEMTEKVLSDNRAASYVFYFLLILAAAFFLYIIIKKFLSMKPDHPEKELEYQQEIVSIHKEIRRRSAPHLTPVRQMYRKILRAGIAKGYPLKNSSTSKDFTSFLKGMGWDPGLLSELNDIYEKERYYRAAAAEEIKKFIKVCTALLESSSRR